MGEVQYGKEHKLKDTLVDTEDCSLHLPEDLCLLYNPQVSGIPLQKYFTSTTCRA
jgi:hypothetical protein